MSLDEALHRAMSSHACQRCGAPLSATDSTCPSCGAGAWAAYLPATPGQRIDRDVGFARNLIRGNFGLSKTFWLYDVTGGLCVAVLGAGIMGIAGSSILDRAVLCAWLAWQASIFLAVWRAGARYEGSDAWSTLAYLCAGSKTLFLAAMVVTSFSR